MKRTKLLMLSLLMSVGLVLGVASVGQAKWSDSIANQERVTVAAGQTHQGSLYAAGDQVVIDGTVNGDLYCGARELVVSGEVTGDIMCGVQTATVDGKVGQDLRLAGQYATINGEVVGSLTFFGQDLKLLANSSVGGDVNGAGQYVTIGGPVDGNIVTGTQSLTLQSTVGGDVNSAAQQVSLSSNARVAGDFNYAAEVKQTIDESLVDGEVSYNQVQTQQHNQVDSYGWLVTLFVVMLVSALVVAALAPRFVDRSRAVLNKNSLMVGLIGFAVLFALPFVAVAMMVTVVLLPVGLLMLVLWLATMLLSNYLFAYWLGSLAFASQRNVLVRMAAGMAILFVLYLIPVINGLVFFASLVIGMGMVVATITDGYRRPSYTLAAAKTKAKKK